MSTNLLAAMTMNNDLLLASFIAAVGFGVLCAWFADRRGRPMPLWALLGFCFGVIALVVIVVLPSRKKPPAPPSPSV